MGKRRYRRKTRRRRRRFRRRKPRPQKSLMGQSKVLRHKWCFAGQFAVATNLCVTETFRLLSPFDPKISGPITQPQPLGFSQMSSIFDNCQVLGVMAKLIFLPSTSQHNVVYWSEISTEPRQGQPSINLQGILDRKNTNYTFLATNQGNATKQVLTRKVNPKKYFDLVDLRDSPLQKCIPANSVAAEDLYLNAGFSSTHAGLGTAIVGNDYVVLLSYIINWYSPKGNVP